MIYYEYSKNFGGIKMRIYESRENYLETILVLKKLNGQVRSIDIARKLNFSKPSVSRAIGILKEDGFVVIDRDGYIEFTEKGKQKAESVYDRHNQITEFLISIVGVSADIAEEDACRIEHVISEETFLKIKEYLNEAKQ